MQPISKEAKVTELAENAKDQKNDVLGKIQPLTQSSHEKLNASLDIDKIEKSLIQCVRLLLRELGVRKSAAAVREAVNTPFDKYAPKHAVLSLQNLGFKAGFGQINVVQIHKGLLPGIAFSKSGEPLLVKADEENDGFYISTGNGEITNKSVSRKEFAKDFSGYFVIAKQLTSVELERVTGHWFFSAFRKSRWTYLQVMLAAMVSNFISITTSIFTMTVYDRIIPNGAFDSLLALTIGVVMVLAFDFIIRSLRARFIDTASKKADLEISNRLFDKILDRKGIQGKQRTGTLAGTIREFETLRDFFNSSTLVVLVDLPFVLFFIYIIYLIAGPLAYVPMVCVPIVVLVGLGIQPFLARVTKGATDSGMDKQSVLIETISGLETVTATGSGPIMRKRYQDALNNQTEGGNRIRSLSNFVVNFAASIQQYAQVATIMIGVYLIIDGTISQGALIGAMILGGRTMAPLSQLANTLSRLNSALAAYRSLDNLFKKNNESNTNSSPISRPKLSGEIEFRNVSYSFPGSSEKVIKNLSFKVVRGQKVAIVGKMGSGKSTLSRLISGVIEPTEGAVLIDGIDVRQIDRADLRKNIGVMPQESWLFSGTVRENIQMGYNEYEDDHILKICNVAGVDEFVGQHPKGYELEIKENGHGLSGGQQQTINLARSLLHDPSILLLDEPTSSMDQTTEKKVVASLQDYAREKTMFVVTHRNPILTLVDRVLIMENGNIIADQTPAQLGVKKGNETNG